MSTPRALLAPLPICILAFSFTGCKTSAPPIAAFSRATTVLAAPAKPRSSVKLSIQTDPRYQEAVCRYASGDRSGPSSIISNLLASPNLPEPDRAFLKRQKALCSPSVNSDVGRGRRPAPSSGSEPAPLQDCGPRALQILCKQLGKDTDLDRLRKECGTTDKGASLYGLAKAARAHGLKAEGIQVNREALNELKTPAIAWVNGNHYVAVLKVKDRQATLIDPNLGKEEVIETEELLRRSGGILLTISR